MDQKSRLQVLGPHGISLICVILTSGVFSIVIGMVMPLLPLRMNSWGTSELWIGVNALPSSVALLFMVPRISGLVSRIGIANTVLLGAFIFSTSVLALGLFENIYIWFGIRAFLGIGMGMLWVGMELWVNAAAPDAIRGRVLGVYAGIFATFTAFGPVVLNFVGSSGLLPFIIIVAVAAVSMIPIFFGKSTAPQFSEEGHASIRSVFILAPFLMIIGAMSGLGDGSAWSLLAIFGLKAGLSESAAIYTISAHLAGAVVCQVPIAYLTDKIDRSKLMFAVAIGALGATTVMWFADADSYIFWAALFFNGGFLMGLYTIPLSIIGSRFSGKGMAAANAAFIMCFEVGVLTGAPAAGAAMEWTGSDGLLYVIGGACFVAVAVLPFHLHRNAKRKAMGMSTV